MPIGLVTAGVAAAGAIGAAVISSSSSSKAAKTVQQGADTATAEQQREYNQSRADLQPWLSTGSAALAKLAKLYGLDSGPAQMPASSVGGTVSGQQPVATGPNGGGLGLNKNGNNQFLQPEGGAFSLDPGLYAPQGTTSEPGSTTASQSNSGATDPNADFYQSPDYMFRLSQGLGGVDAGAASRGSLDSGATRKAEIAYAGNLASGEYSNYANRLAAIAGVGQTAANTDAATGASTATNISNIAQNAANNQASSYLAQGQGYANAISQAAGIGSGLITNLYTPQSYDTAFGSAISSGAW